MTLVAHALSEASLPCMADSDRWFSSPFPKHPSSPVLSTPAALTLDGSKGRAVTW